MTRAKAAPTQILVCFVQNQRGRLVVVCLEEFSGSCSRREVMSWNSGPKSGEGWDIVIVFIHPSMKGAKVLNQVWGGVGYNYCVYSSKGTRVFHQILCFRTMHPHQSFRHHLTLEKCKEELRINCR